MIKRYHTLGLHEKETKYPTNKKKTNISMAFLKTKDIKSQ